jgi:pyrimidine operon attenuation protein/uracil phosphoribosyltransferase
MNSPVRLTRPVRKILTNNEVPPLKCKPLVKLTDRGFLMQNKNERLILNSDDLRRAITRIAHEILERNKGAKDLVLVGLHTRGVPLAQRIAKTINSIEGTNLPIGKLDISLYRDDFIGRAKPIIKSTELPVPIEDQVVILVDDVLYTGRSIRAAMDALTDFGRAKSIQLAVLVDRGHREVPIRPDYIGKNIPTSRNEAVSVRLEEVDCLEEVTLAPNPGLIINERSGGKRGLED